MKKSFILLWGILSVIIAFSQGTWEKQTDFPGPQTMEAVSFSMGNYGYVAGGMRQLAPPVEYSKSFYRYDFIDNSWLQLSDMPSATAEGVCFKIGSNVFLVTGEDPISFKNNMSIWDSATETWSVGNQIPSEVMRIRGLGFSINGKGYVTCGIAIDQTVVLNDLWEFNPDTEQWTEKSNLPGPPRFDAACFIINDKAYITTGFTGNGNSLADLWEYDPATDHWTEKACLPGQMRDGCTAFSIGEYGYLAWGKSNDGQVLHNDTWQYNPQLDSWVQVQNFPSYPSYYGRSFVINECAFVVTGSNYAFPKSNWSFSPISEGLNRKTPLSFPVFPNPVKDELTIQLPSGFQNEAVVELKNLQGQLVKTVTLIGAKIVQIDLSDLIPGCYLLEISAKSKSPVFRKILKK